MRRVSDTVSPLRKRRDSRVVLQRHLWSYSRGTTCRRTIPEPVLGQGHGQLLLARESLPRRLSSHPQGRPDGRPRGAKHSRPVHEAGEIAFDLRAGGSHPREARKYSVEVKVLFPRRQPCWQRRWAADDLAAQIDTFVADVNPWTSNQFGDFVVGLQAERTRCDYWVLCDGHRHLPWLSGITLRRQGPPDKEGSADCPTRA